MKAFILSIGDELLIGQTVNTNVAKIGEALTSLRIRVKETHVVGDEVSPIMKAFEEGFANYDIVIVTGGLGPTHDDITLKCVAKYFNSELVIDENILEDIKQFFKKRGRPLTKLNEEQALVPKIAKSIRNTRGTAPGIWIEKENKIFIVMPGVPFEMSEMMDSFIVPKLKGKMLSIEGFIITLNLLTTGIPESMLYERLGNLDELLQGAKLAFLPNQYGVKMRITVSGKDEGDATNRTSEIEQKIRGLVGRFIYGKNNDTMEDVVGRLLKERGLKIATAESCTGGLIANRLTNVSGSSSYFERGIVSYTNASKVENLKVDEDLIQKYGAVSIEVARQMAEGIKSISGSDIGLAVTGIMGPTGATKDKPVGLVYISLCDDKICAAKEFRFGDDRLLNKDRTSQAALEMLRRNLLSIPYDE
ncbi:MAG: competence/damage-inducible protein A [bacterium]